MTALAWSVPVLALAGCAAWACRGRIRSAVLRARWAWACRKPPSLSEGKPLDHDEFRAFIAAVEAWRHPAVPGPERSRT